MARIAGVDLPRRKHLVYALPYLYGIGRTTAKEICKKAKIPENKRVEELTDAEVKLIRDVLDFLDETRLELRRATVVQRDRESLVLDVDAGVVIRDALEGAQSDRGPLKCTVHTPSV